MKHLQKQALSDICILQRGFDLPKDQRHEGPVALISSSGCIDRHNIAMVKGPGVVTGRSGSIGSVFYIENDFWPLNTTLYVRDFFGNLPKFIFYLLQSIDLKKYASGAGVPTLNRNNIHKIHLSIPNIFEQKRIVAILDDAFERIDTAIKNTEKNIENAKELFESYLNKIFSCNENGWAELHLKDASIEFGRGKSKHRPRNDPSLYGGEYPFIQTGDVRRSDHYIDTYNQTYNTKGLSQSKLWPNDTVCITIAANIAETGILSFEACFPDSVIGIVANPEITSCEYIEYILQYMRSKLKKEGKGSAQDNINLATFESMTFPFAPLPKQTEIVLFLNKLRMVTRNLESSYQQKLTALNELKQSILQKAFAGELTSDFNPEALEI